MALTDLLQGLSVTQLALTTFTLVLGIYTAYLFTASRSVPAKSPPLVKGEIPFIGSLAFWTRRFDFLTEAARLSTNGHFSFHVGQHHVVGLSGDEGRRVFLESKQLDMGAGYAALFAGSPEPPKDQSQDDDDGDDDDGVEMSGHEFAKRLLGMLKKENLDNILQLLISDVQIRLDDLAKDPKGMTDPFESIYGIVYQLTIRTVACNEIADNRALLDQTLDLYQQLEAASSPEVIIFPWLPSPSKLKRLWGGGKLYMIFKNIIEKRQKTGHRENDALQYLIDKGDNIKAILVFVIGALFAGLLNSGINAGWVLIYLAKDPHWRSQVWKEVKSVAEKYDKDATKSWPERLRSVPVEAWEAEFPTIDMCLRDSIRLHAPGSMFRRNTSNKAVKLTDDTEIPPGAYAAYAIGDVHLDPQTYPNPLQWDPSRYLPDKAEDQKKKLAYLGWGAGRHPCLGMRFAKLEQNIILAFFLAYFDFELVDKDGNSGVQLPKPAINDYSATKPKERVFVKYEPRV